MSEPAPFARRLIRLRGSRQVELSPVEKGGDPEAIAGENIVLGSDKETQEIGPPRASSLYSDCMRMRVLGVKNDKTMSRWGGVRNRLTFGIGNAIHNWVQNDPTIFGDRRRGWWRCYDNQTEVLTDSGFKFFKDVAREDKIATLNRFTGQLEYHLPCAKQGYWYTGKMIEFPDSHMVSLCVTPDHNMFVDFSPRAHEPRFGLLPAKHLLDLSYFKFRKDSRWKGEIDRLVPGRIPLEKYLVFMGWYLAEGYFVVTKKGRGYRLGISQASSATVRAEIAALLRSIGLNPYVTNREVCFHSRYWYKYLEQFGRSHDKFIPRNIKNLPPSYLCLFLDAFTAGDGHVDSKGRTSLYTASMQMRDDLQEIVQKLGWSSSYWEDNRSPSIGERVLTRNGPVFNISINKNKVRPAYGPRDGGEVFLTDYEGMVYDLTVPNHVMLVRRAGKLVFSGNCTACLQIRYFGGPPKKRCENCDANARATVYHEHRIRIREPLIVDGHVDMFFEKSAGIFRPVELKSMSGDLFEKLKAPIVKDEWQLLTYLWGGAIDKNLPVKLDNVGYIVYFAKKEFRASLPVKMFPIRKQPNIVAMIKEKLQMYKDGMEGYPKVLPKPHDTCIRHGGSGQERNCPTRGLCSSFWKDGI